MRAKRTAAVKDAAAKHFPIFSYEEFDFTFDKGLWPVGLKSTYPEELVRRVGAAMISFQMGNSAIDYTYKKYLKDHHYEMDDGSRLDLRISHEISRKSRLFSEVISEVTELGSKREGQFVCEWTFLRVPFAIQFLLSCANRGALFESTAIARMILEQIAWCNAIDRLEDFDGVRETSATKSIGLLKTTFESVGRLYGWLSAQAHWAYDGHIKAMRHENGQTSALFATPKFKACSLALTNVILILAMKVFALIRASEIEALRKGLETSAEPSLLKSKLPSFLDLSSLSSLTRELAEHYPEDVDILDLSEIVFRESAEGKTDG